MTAAADTQQADGPLLTALQLVRAMLPGVLARKPMEQHVQEASSPARDVLDLYRDFAAGAGTRREIAPTVMALGTLSVALLQALNETPERVEEWLRVQARTVEEHVADEGAEHSPDPTVVAVASVLAEELRNPDPEQHEARARRVEELVAGWMRAERGGSDRYELLLSGAQLSAWLLASAMRGDRARAEAYLDTYSRMIIARNGPPATATATAGGEST